MNLNSINKSFLIPLITSCIAFALIVNFLGIYFESYDALFNQSILGSFSYRPYQIWNSDSDFLLIPIVCYLQDLFPTISILGITKAIRIFFVLFSIHYLIFKLTTNWIKYIITVIITIFICEHLMIANNVRLSTISIAVALILYQIIDNKNLYEKTIIAILIIMGVFARFDSAMLLLPILLLFTFLFNTRLLLKPIAAVLILSMILLGTYYYSIKYDDINVKNFKKYERSLTDRQDAIFRNKISTPEKMSRDELINMGIGLFIEDELPLKKENFIQIVKHKSLYEYVFKNKEFLAIWTHKNLETVQLIYEKLRFTMLAIIGVATFLFIISSSTKRIKIIIWSLALLCYPFAINILFSTPERLVTPYFSSLLMFLIVYLIRTLENQAIIKKIVPVLLFIGIFHLFITIKSSNEKLKKEELESEKVMAAFVEDNKANIIPAINMVYFTEIFPSNIFNKHSRLKLIFINSYAFGKHSHILNYNKNYFGNSFYSIVDRYSFIAQRQKYIYSDEYMMRFTKAYLLKVHNIKLITDEPIMISEKIGKYKFIIE